LFICIVSGLEINFHFFFTLSEFDIKPEARKSLIIYYRYHCYRNESPLPSIVLTLSLHCSYIVLFGALCSSAFYKRHRGLVGGDGVRLMIIMNFANWESVARCRRRGCDWRGCDWRGCDWRGCDWRPRGRLESLAQAAGRKIEIGNRCSRNSQWMTGAKERK
jgi:hypothetical protein